jgi:hypothetical protein
MEDEEVAKMNLTLQYLLHFTLKLYYDSTRQPLLMKPGYNHFDEKTRKNKRFENKLVLDHERFLVPLDYKPTEAEEVKEPEKSKDSVDTTESTGKVD